MSRSSSWLTITTDLEHGKVDSPVCPSTLGRLRLWRYLLYRIFGEHPNSVLGVSKHVVAGEYKELDVIHLTRTNPQDVSGSISPKGQETGM